MEVIKLLIVFGVLALVAVVLLFLVWKLSQSKSEPGYTPAPVPSPTPVPKHAPGPVSSAGPPVSPEPVRNHPGGEQEFFNIRGTRPGGIWICPVCGAENSSTNRCQICAVVRK